MLWFVLLFQAEDGIRCLVRSRGLGDVYKRQALHILIGWGIISGTAKNALMILKKPLEAVVIQEAVSYTHLTLPTSDLV